MAQIDTDGIGRRVAKYRKANKMSAQKLADETGLTRSVIANIENGRKSDPAISEVLSIARSLRVPVAALLYPIERPLGPVHDLDEEDIFFTRVVDAIDFLNRTESEAEDNAELLEFQAQMNELDFVVLYPMGISVYSTYSKAGREALALIEAGRGLAKVQSRFDSAHYDFMVVFRLAVSHFEQVDSFEADEEILASGGASRSALVESAASGLEDSDAILLKRLARRLDRAAIELKRARESVRALGGDPSTDGFRSASLWRAMSLVQSMPHEAGEKVIARKQMAEGQVSSPLRENRGARLAKLREMYAVQSAQWPEESAYGEHPEAP